MKHSALPLSVLDQPGRRAWLARCLSLLALIILVLVFLPTAQAIPLTGANGTTIDFAGVKAATPEGLVVKILADSDVATVPWDKFDLARLQTEQPAIFAAYQKAQAGESTDLFLGVFASEKPQEMAPDPAAGGGGARDSTGHFVQTEVSGPAGSGFSRMTVAMRKPSPNAKAIFLAAFGEGRGSDAFSSIYVARGVRTSWDEFLDSNSLVPVGVRVDWAEGDPRKEPFFLADKGSGDALIEAIATLAREAGRDDLASAPIVIYGREVIGSALAYNFAQYKPERTMCVVAMKGGAFFQIEPTDASIKTPVLLLKGEYDDSWREWEIERTVDERGAPADPPHEAVQRYRSALEMRPYWTLAIEPRGRAEFSPMTEMLGRAFIEAVIKQRFGGGTLTDMHPDIAYLGNMEEPSIKNMPDDRLALNPEETWLPDQTFAEIWLQFIQGQLVPPAPTPPQ